MSDEPNDTEQPQDSPDDIRFAKEMGWKDPSDWQGDPPKNGFVSAKEYVRRSEKVLPIVNARARNAEEKAAKLEAKLEQMETDHRDTIKRIERMTEAALKQQRSQIEADYATRKEAAVETGDKAAYKQAVKDEKEATQALDERLKDEPADKEKKKEEAKLPKAIQEAIDEWLNENPWFNQDDELNGYANGVYKKMRRENPGFTEKQVLAEVRKRTVKRFPEAFHESEADNPSEDEDRPRASRVEGGSRMNGGGGKSLYSKLPAEAKSICDKFIKEDGLFLEKGETSEKNLSQARERYAQQYLGDAA